MQIASHYLSASSFHSHPSIQDDAEQLDPYSPDHSSDFGSDFGGLVHTRPASVLHPASTSDVQLSVQNTTTCIAPRGNGHSVGGQSQCQDGLVIDMRSHVLPNGDRFRLVDGSSADVSGGALWSELLTWSYGNFKLAPVSWTDYLDLTVGGTLSNGGISGQAFRRGPQTSNVIEVDVVTADGECRVCSRESGSDLFFAVLGGLGQFGVITRARIVLAPAPDMVRWIRVVYTSFENYKRDSELLITRPESETFDYIEGFAFLNCDDATNGYGSVPLSPESEFDCSRIPADSGPILYCLEAALHYRQGDSVDKRAAEMLDPLRHVRGLEFIADVGYVEFLTRVKVAEKEARANGSWHAPHPWLNILVSSRNIIDFDRNVFKKILKNGIGGPMLVYPLLKSKWGPQISVALPESEIFYLVALLRFNRPYPDGPSTDDLIDQNRRILECCKSNRYDYKVYLPHYETRSEWEQHFGNEWARFCDRKLRYDPTAIFAPGQCIFTEGKIRVEEEDGNLNEGVL